MTLRGKPSQATRGAKKTGTGCKRNRSPQAIDFVRTLTSFGSGEWIFMHSVMNRYTNPHIE